MKKIIINIRILIPLLFFTFYGCIKPSSSCPDIYTINENIVPLENTLDYYSAIWVNDSTIYLGSRGIAKVNDQLQVTSMKHIPELNGAQFLHLNPARTKMLWIVHRHGGVGKVIKEYDIETNVVSIIFSSTSPLMDALYYYDDNYIVLSSDEYQGGIIYLHNRTTHETTQIYMIPEGFEHGLSAGVDAHPTKSTLLIPVVQNNYFPYIIEYDVELKKTDTLLIFDQKSMNVWLRYNPNGEKILFSLYPSYLHGYSSIGIIDRNTLKIQTLDVNTSKTTKSLNLFPNWSPDSKHIIYSSGVDDECRKTETMLKSSPPYVIPSLYILKNAN